MIRRIPYVAGALAVAAFVPSIARAQSAPVYYTPPSLLKQGSSTTPISGAGTVVVQVLVDKSGSFKVVKVIRSSAVGDNAAALEIAKSSTYKPATRGSAKQTAYYDFTLRFKAGGATSSVSAPGATSGIASFEQQIRSGNYTAAKTGLTSYVAQHPDDQKAQTDLGVADTFVSDFEGAAAAFDKVQTIAPNYKALAAKAYAEDASIEIKNKANDKAVSAAKHATQLAPGFYTFNTLGFAESGAGQNDAAIADLEHARSLGASDPKVKPKERAVVDANLVSAYLGLDKPDVAKPIAMEAVTLDPSITAEQNIANYYEKQAQTSLGAGKPAVAAGLYDEAAGAVPAQKGALYARAALSYINLKPTPDYVDAKATADKALAAEPESALANFVAGVSLANQSGKSKDALVYLNKADASAKTGTDANLTAAIENAIKQLNGTK